MKGLRQDPYDATLVEAQRHKSGRKGRQKHVGSRFDDKVNRPGIVAPADEVEMPGAALVPICPKVHGVIPRLAWLSLAWVIAQAGK
jgi:hypothetical protein